jgi:tryptophanase
MRDRAEYAEPFRAKMVERIRLLPPERRAEALRAAGYNVFGLPSEAVYVDLLTDSGTAAMSDEQWAGLMVGDEAYAGSRSYDHLRAAVEDVFGYPHVAPTHQGRAAEHILMTIFVQPGDRVLGNMHFDTTQGHILLKGAEPVDLVAGSGLDPRAELPFKGNLDLGRLERELDLHRAQKQRVPFVLITVTCNNNGGQPVSMANIREAARLAHLHGVPLFFDAARFAENCFFIREREPGYADKTVAEIAREMFSCGDGCTMSAKKDGLVNIGGFLAFRDLEVYRRAVQWQIVFEGFATYGGLAGRDLEAMARGLLEVLDPEYLEDRVGQVAYLAEQVDRLGVPRVRPSGGHGVYLDARGMLPEVPAGEFPGQAVVAGLYLAGGVRAVELGSLAFARRDPATGHTIHPPNELVRLAIPRRVYSDRHMDHVARSLGEVWARRAELRGFRLTYEAPVLRHFTARLEPLG